jgi:hypothetical protein
MDEAYYYIHPRKGVPFAPLLSTLCNLALKDVTLATKPARAVLLFWHSKRGEGP